MFTNEWLQWLKRSFRRFQNVKRPKTGRARPRYRPLLEPLEDRSLMTVTVLSTASVTSGSPLVTSNGQSEAVPVHSISDNGRFTVYSSDATNLVLNQSTPVGQLNVFLHDNQSGATTLISHQYGNPTTAGTSNYGPVQSFNPVISGDGSTVAFYSTAGDLVSGEYVNSSYVGLYLYTVTGPGAGTITLASHAYNDASTVAATLNPVIPASSSANWANTLGYSAGWATVGQDVNGLAVPSLSYDGKYVAFISDANNLAGANTGGDDQLYDGGYFTNAFVYDNNPADSAAYGTTAIVSHAAGNSSWSATNYVTYVGAGAWATTVAISADGSTVAFTDPGTNLVPGQSTDGQSDQLYVWSRITNPNTGLLAGQTILASHAYGYSTTGASNPSGWAADNPPSLSANGSEVAYYSAGNNLVSGQTGSASVLNVFRYNVLTNTNDLVTHSYGNNTTAGNNPQNQVAPPGMGAVEATGPQISANGQYIAYANNSDNLLASTFTGTRDNVYLYDASTHHNTLVSNNGTATTPDAGGGTAPSMSSDGMYVTFADLAIPATGSLSGAAGVVNVRLYTRGSSSPPTVVGQSWDNTSIPPLQTGSNGPASLELYASGLQPTVISADGTTIVWSGPASTNVTVPSVTDSNTNLDVFEAINPNATTTGQVPVITSSNSLTLTTGTQTPFTITATNTPTLFTLTPTTTMPAGLTFNTTTGVLTGTATTPGTYTLRATATNSSGTSSSQTFTITVDQVPIITATPSTTFTVGTTNSYTITATGFPTPTITSMNLPAGLTLTSSGLLTGTPTAGAGTYPFNITATDAAGSASETFTLTVDATPPTAILLTNATVTAAQPIGTTVGTLTTTDPNANQTFIYTLTPGTPFTIVGNTLETGTVIQTTTQLSIPITIQTTDSLGLSHTQSFAIIVNPSTAAPTNITLSNSTATAYQPSGTLVGTVGSTDPNVGQTVSYTLTGPNASQFTIDSAGHVLTNGVFATTTTQTYSVTVTATDSLNLSSSQNFTITVNPSTAAPTNITLSNSTATAYQPSGTLVGTVGSTDPNVGQTVSYTLTGPNASQFTIDSAGHVLTNGVFATTTPQTYSVTVVATDSLNLSSSHTFTITVNPSTAPPTAITLTNATVTAYRSSGTLVGTVGSTDPNVGQRVTYTLTGPNAGDFTIDSAGELKTSTVLSTTTPQTYSVTVVATDSLNLSSSETFTITAEPSTVAPANITLTNAAVTAYRPVGAVIGSLGSTDPNVGQSTSYTLSGPNASLFTVDSAGNLKTNSALTPQTYSVTVVATDSLNLSSSQTFTIVVNAPVAATVSLSADESATVGDVYGNPLVATVYDAAGYPVPNASVAFTLPVSGPGGTLTTLLATTDANGQVSETLTANDTAGSFTVGVNVNSGSNPSSLFHLTNLADVPASVILSGDNQTAPLGTAFGSPLTATVLDAHNNPVPDVTVTFTLPNSGAGGTVSSLTGVTNASGQFSETLTANSTLGAFTVGVAVAGGSNPTSEFLHLTNVASAPVSVTLTGSGQSATVGQAYGSSLVVTVLDAFGQPVPNQTVTFTRPTTAASGILSATTGITNSSGQVTVHFSANTIAGSVSIGVAVTGGSNPTGAFHLTNNADVPASVTVTGSKSSATVATNFATPLVATVLDRFGNPVVGVTVTFRLPITGASGTLSGGVTGITDANGKVTKILTANTRAGVYSVGVGVTGGSNPTNTIVKLTNIAGAAVSMTMAFVNPPARFLAGNQLPNIVVQLLDQYGNNAAPAKIGTPVTITLGASKRFRSGASTATAKFSASGTATFAGLFIDLAGTDTLQMSSANMVATNSLSFVVAARTSNAAKGLN